MHGNLGYINGEDSDLQEVDRQAYAKVCRGSRRLYLGFAGNGHLGAGGFKACR